MSDNCVRCVVNPRSGWDLLCDECREIEWAQMIDELDEGLRKLELERKVDREKTGE